MPRPFLCSKCGNWYAPVPRYDPATGEHFVCYTCQEKKHAGNPKTGVVDCHAFDESATMSERLVAEALIKAEAVANTKDLPLAEKALKDAETAGEKVPEAVKWAGVFELPGRKNDRQEDRFKGYEVVEKYVEQHRRPESDLITLQRSIKNCREMAEQLP
mgnify:FL=1